jgi:hypothetical protein
MTTTLAETVAWSTGAAWPVDGETATIGSIASQVQELKDRSNYLKSKTNQLASKYSVAGVQFINTPNPVSIATSISATPTAVADAAALTTISCLVSDVIHAQLGPFLVKNSSATDTAFVDVFFADNSASPASAIHVLIPPSTTISLNISCVHVVGTAGYCLLSIQHTGNTTGGASFQVLENTTHLLGTLEVLRPVT